MHILRGKVREEGAVIPSVADFRTLVALVVETLITYFQRCLVVVEALILTWEEVVLILAIWVEVNIAKANKISSNIGNNNHPRLQKKRYRNFLSAQTSYN